MARPLSDKTKAEMAAGRKLVEAKERQAMVYHWWKTDKIIVTGADFSFTNYTWYGIGCGGADPGVVVVQCNGATFKEPVGIFPSDHMVAQISLGLRCGDAFDGF